MASKAAVAREHTEAHVLREARVLAACCHPFIPRLAGACADATHLYQLHELCGAYGTLHDLMSARRLSEDDSRFYLANCLLALEHLHAKGIAHRDLKPESLLLCANGYLRLGAFHYATFVPGKGRCFTLCGTLPYMAPEMLLRSGHDEQVSRSRM